MEKTAAEKVKTIYFVSVAVLMYFFLVEYIDLGIQISFRHFFALVLAFSAICLFLIKPDFGRAFVAFPDALTYSAPLLVTTVVSLFIWFVGTVDTSVITRGLSSTFLYTNMLSCALAAGTFLYVFGEKGVMYNLVAILLANLLIIATIILEYGIGPYFSELVALIVTFAAETGDIIIHAEVHELAFCIGAYLIYFAYKPKKSILYFVLLFVSLFCFLSAFKRIAMIAIAVALAFGFLLRLVAKYSDKAARRLITFLTILLIAILVLYVALIKADVFVLLEKAGINTSGRVEIYDAVDKFYEFHPGFLGNGIGFLNYQLNTNMQVGVASVHNDFLQHFIDLGFFGYLFWLGSMTILRVRRFGKDGRTDGAIISFMLILYLIVVSSTDNTMNYPLLTGTLAVLMMGTDFDNRVKEKEDKLLRRSGAEKERK